MAIGGAKRAGKPIAVCGEMAGDVTMTHLLLGLGLEHFSMHPAHLLQVKQRVLASSYQALAQAVTRIRRQDDPVKIVAMLERLNA
jgi:phosphotransferase system enzyme I (PtsI)